MRINLDGTHVGRFNFENCYRIVEHTNKADAIASAFPAPWARLFTSLKFLERVPLPLYRAAGHAADYLLLEEDVAEDGGDYRNDDRRVHGDVVGRELVGEVAYADLDRAQLFRRYDEVCEHELVPAGQELERGGGDDARAGQWQDNMPEARKEAAAVDIRRFLKLHRDGVHQPANEEGGHRDADGGIQEYHAAVGVVKSELIDDDKVRHH